MQHAPYKPSAFTRSAPRFHAGFSLTELMVAMALSLVLLAGTLVVFTSGRESYVNIDHLSRVQENGRYAIDQILRDLRAAGYNGCVKTPTTTTTLNTPTALAWNFNAPVAGFNGSATVWSPALDASLTGFSPTVNNDVLVIRMPKAGVIAGRVTTLMAAGTSAIAVTATTPAPVALNDTVMVSNCEARAYFEVTGYSTAGTVGTITHAASAATTYSPGNASADVVTAFGPGSEVIPVMTNTYFIAPSTATATIGSLWRKPSTGPVEELVEGVNSLQIMYGIDTDNDQQVNTYVTAQGVTDWATVISVRVALLIQSLEEYGSSKDNKTYTVLGVSAGPFNDSRLRQLFTATATLRNKTL
jgi:type IV pilus assembly protein PilW